MNENYIVINGKKIELTEEQLRQLGIGVRQNPFKRVVTGDVYYNVNEYSEIVSYIENTNYTDQYLYDKVNYFNDEAFANQVALHQLLYRKLLKFAYDNNCEDTKEWDGSNTHWSIRYGDNHDEFFVYSQERYKTRDVYFSTKEGAERAIKEVVEPFVKEHPEFVW